MTSFQILMVVLAVVLVGSSFIDTKTILAKIKDMFKETPKKDVSIDQRVTVPMPDIDVTPYITPKKELKVSDIVYKWEELRSICVANDLVASTSKLDDMFGTFLDLVKEEATNDKQKS